MRIRRSRSNGPVETLASPSGSGFRFAAEAFAEVVARGDFAATAGAAQASLDIAAMLDAIEASAAQGGAPVDLPG